MKKVVALLLALTMVISLVGCGGSSGSKETDGGTTKAAAETTKAAEKKDEEAKDTIKVGVLYPLTGNNATAGTESVKCLETVAELINGSYDIDFPGASTEGIQSMGGAKIEIIAADTQASAEVSATEAERLITEEGVDALIGCDLSSCTKTASAVAEKYGVPFINGESSSDSLVGRGLDYFFHVGPNDSLLIASSFDYLDSVRDSVGIDSVAICGSDDDSGTNFVKYCEQEAQERGYEVKTSFTYSNDAATLSSECMKLKSSEADVLLIFALTAPAILYLQTMEEMDINFKTMITARGGFIATEFFDTVGDASEYVMTENTWSLDSVSDKPYVAEINDMCVEKAGCAMNGNYARAMQAFFVLVDALERAGSADGEALKDALWATDMDSSSLICPWEGIKFSEDGQNVYAAGIMTQVQNGKYVTIDPEVEKAVIPVPAWSER